MPSVIAYNGKQYLVGAGQKFTTTKSAHKESEVVECDDLLSPGSKVKIKFLGLKKGPKTKILKFKNKSRHLKRLGHRQEEAEWQVLDESVANIKSQSKPAKSKAKK